MSNTAENYAPSPALRKLVLKLFNTHYPDGAVTEKVLSDIEHILDSAVRGLIGTIGLGLDSAKRETYQMTENGVLRDRVKKCYLYRLPVKADDADALYAGIVADLFKYAGSPIMDLAYGQLVEKDGELVVIGKRKVEPKENTGWVRAEVFIPE